MTDQQHADLNLAIIGNCTQAALVDQRARIVWACVPAPGRRPGPVQPSERPFRWRPERANSASSKSRSRISSAPSSTTRHNTAILVTTLFDKNGQAVEITDFAPRFRVYGRMHRPLTLIRMVKPIAGNPRIRIRLRPRFDYGAIDPETTRGSNHIRYVAPTTALRLTTDMPVSYVVEETPFILESPVNLLFGADESLTASIAETAHTFLRSTNDYWTEFCRYLALPFEWQDAVIRAAITLKLCSFEETRRHRRGHHHIDPGGAAHRPQLGLSLLLAAGFLFRGACAQPPGRDQDHGGLPPLHHQHRRRFRERLSRPAVQHHPAQGTDRADLRSSDRLSWHGAGPGGQCGLFPGPERRLWRRHPVLRPGLLRRAAGTPRHAKAL